MPSALLPREIRSTSTLPFRVHRLIPRRATRADGSTTGKSVRNDERDAPFCLLSLKGEDEEEGGGPPTRICRARFTIPLPWNAEFDLAGTNLANSWMRALLRASPLGPLHRARRDPQILS